MDRIIELARSLVQKYYTRDPFKLCEELRVHVVYTELPKTVEGFYQYIDGYKFIYLNNALDEDALRVICAHELAHALLHTDYNVLELLRDTFFYCPRFEREADIFCAALLIDEAEAQNTRPELLSMDELAALSGVPVELVDLRFAEGF
ncbi:ImmA/IrrE family metallo-endopeptidase [Acetanaerobacterium elongatum]|uniref:IrrE N-terminal-like domain-containing protein n=1 Tax=Acetanaerobacterium elongatum TaxID=258515 RepID=A0A1G9V9N0_9FIRM|nr:ImmA/IrrE family metallo-endopeptidase [Acetanaerobacterium elongatum]SDM68918.1 protein of unknown function [Acetanaerobacterium elongatum]